MNNYKVPNRKVPGMYYLTQRAKDFREACLWLCVGKRRFTTEVEVDVELHPPAARRYDVDNWTKSVLDGLQHARVLEDDSIVRAIRIAKCDVAKPGAVIVRVWSVVDS